jgi:Uncharacterized protein conserved in bacteria
MARRNLSGYSLEQWKEIVERDDANLLAEYAPIPPEDVIWAMAPLPQHPGKTSVHLRVDTDVLQWFRGQGKGHLTRMNAVLRAYMDANRRRG